LNYKKKYGYSVYLSDKEKDSLMDRFGAEETKSRIVRLNQMKENEKRALQMKSDYQAIGAMGERGSGPLKNTEEIKKMKKVLAESSERDYFIFLIGINTGMKTKELLNLKVKHIRDKRFIKLSPEGTEYPINKNLKSRIFEYTASMRDEEFLFTSRKTGQALQRDRVHKILKQAGEEAGVAITGTHTMRKTFGYHFFKQYEDAAFLQKLFHHSSQSVTLRYIGITDEKLKDAMDEFSL
jgi:integrase